jgi:S-adenosylmethionine:tRNA ribosyltransferase-isomerase
MELTLADFDYDLPDELIAQMPAARRSGSRLLALAGDDLQDRRFEELPELLSPGDLLVMNDTRVVKARLAGEKQSGGKVEVLVERILSAHEALALIRASHAPKPASSLRLAGAFHAVVAERVGDLYRLRVEHEAGWPALLDRYGRLPLPPYIGHAPGSEDEARYQTVYARRDGAVAAPTAGLHFDEALMQALRLRGIEFAWVTLHVGAGTFQPVRVERISAHRMHAEWFEIRPETAEAVERTRLRGGRVIAVGSTSVRALESAATDAGGVRAGTGDTSIFIVPGYRFRAVDRLITNFHLPKSTLLMLISAFAGLEPVRRAYRHAVERRYRFFSYGDAMLIDRIAP